MFWKNRQTDQKPAQILSTRPNQYLPAQSNSNRPIGREPAQSGNTGGMPRPVIHAPSLDSTPMSKQCHKVRRAENVKRKGENGIASSNLTETQYKSSVANKLVDMAMENMYCKIIAFAPFHLYFAILLFLFAKLLYSCNTSFSFAILYFLLKST